LNNVRRRLADAYPEKHDMSLYEKDGFVHARLVIEQAKGATLDIPPKGGGI
jgi:hypothetical protein